MLAARGARVVLAVPDSLHPLLSTMPGLSQCLPNSAATLPAVDVCSPVSSCRSPSRRRSTAFRRRSACLLPLTASRPGKGVSGRKANHTLVEAAHVSHVAHEDNHAVDCPNRLKHRTGLRRRFVHGCACIGNSSKYFDHALFTRSSSTMNENTRGTSKLRHLLAFIKSPLSTEIRCSAVWFGSASV